ncbi:MAG: cell envelope integrity protein TolA [Pyrinomonadaceae bacterium]
MNCTTISLRTVRPSLAGAALIILFLFFGSTLSAQTAGTAADRREPAAGETEDRIRQLEAQVRAMQAELERIKQGLSAQVPAQTARDNDQVAGAASTKAEVAQPAAAKAETAPRTQQKQIGLELASGARLIPYGTIYFNAFSNSNAVNNQDVPLFAVPTGQGGTSASLRQTRLGLRLEGAKLGSARLGGVIEADFFGGLPSVGIGENFGIVRIRLAHARLDWEKTSVTVGQDWMPFAPLNPVSIASAAIPQMAAAGNNWARIPLVRVDRKLNAGFTLTGAVLAPQTGDHPASSFFLQTTSGSASRVPFLQSRVAFADKNWLGTKKSGSIGLSGHFGRSRVLTGPSNAKREVDSVGVALDWSFPLHARLTWAGEAFFGRDLGGFQAGIFQGLNTDFAYRSGTSVTAAGVRGIGTRGGWTQIGLTPDVMDDRWTLYASIGLDDPRDRDLTSVSNINFRTRNLAFAFNTIYKFTPQFWLGAEYRRFNTRYVNTGRRVSDHVNLGATYSF